MILKICQIIAIIGFWCGSLYASKIVEAQGLGDTLQEAKQDAIANAMREAVGEYVRTNQTLVDDMLDDKTSSFSNAYVLDYKQINVRKLPAGLYEVTARIEIEDGKLSGVLKKVEADTKNVDSTSFKVTMDETYKKLENFDKMFDEVVVKPMQTREAFFVKIISFTPAGESRDKDGDLPYKILFEMGYTPGYLQGIQKFLSSVSDNKPCPLTKWNELLQPGIYGGSSNYNYITIVQNRYRLTGSDEILDRAPASVIWCAGIPKQYKLNGSDVKKLRLKVEFLDSKGVNFITAPKFIPHKESTRRDEIGIFSANGIHPAYYPLEYLIKGRIFYKQPTKEYIIVYLSKEQIQQLKEIKIQLQ